MTIGPLKGSVGRVTALPTGGKGGLVPLAQASCRGPVGAGAGQRLCNLPVP